MTLFQLHRLYGTKWQNDCKLLIGKVVEGSIYSLVKVLSHHLPVRTDDRHKYPFRIASFLTKI